MAGYFTGSTAKDAVGYRCGEDIEFRLELCDGAKRFGCPLFKWEICGDDAAKASGMASGESGELRLHTTLTKPGFVHVIVTACALDGTPLPTIDKFEGGAGADIDKIEQGTLLDFIYIRSGSALEFIYSRQRCAVERAGSDNDMNESRLCKRRVQSQLAALARRHARCFCCVVAAYLPFEQRTAEPLRPVA